MSTDRRTTAATVRAGVAPGEGNALVARAGTCAALLGAALVHATVVGEHYEQWALAGLFFVGLQIAETLLALVVITAWSRTVAFLVLASSIGTLGVWLVSRTVGMPLGPPGFRAAEPVGVADTACVVLELAAVVLVLPAVLGRTTRRIDSRLAVRFDPRLVAATVVLAAAVVTGWGLTPAVSGEEPPAHDQHSAGSQPPGDG